MQMTRRTKEKWKRLVDPPSYQDQKRRPEQDELDTEIDWLGISERVWLFAMMKECVPE